MSASESTASKCPTLRCNVAFIIGRDAGILMRKVTGKRLLGLSAQRSRDALATSRASEFKYLLLEHFAYLEWAGPDRLSFVDGGVDRRSIISSHRLGQERRPRLVLKLLVHFSYQHNVDSTSNACANFIPWANKGAAERRLLSRCTCLWRRGQLDIGRRRAHKAGPALSTSQAIEAALYTELHQLALCPD